MQTQFVTIDHHDDNNDDTGGVGEGVRGRDGGQCFVLNSDPFLRFNLVAYVLHTNINTIGSHQMKVPLFRFARTKQHIRTQCMCIYRRVRSFVAHTLIFQFD